MQGHVFQTITVPRLGGCQVINILRLITQFSSTFRSMYGFLRVLDSVPDFPMCDILAHILTLAPDSFSMYREFEILRLQSKWQSNKEVYGSSGEGDLLKLTEEFVHKLKDLQRPSNNSVQLLLCTTLLDLFNLRGELQASQLSQQ